MVMCGGLKEIGSIATRPRPAADMQQFHTTLNRWLARCDSRSKTLIRRARRRLRATMEPSKVQIHGRLNLSEAFAATPSLNDGLEAAPVTAHGVEAAAIQTAAQTAARQVAVPAETATTSELLPGRDATIDAASVPAAQLVPVALVGLTIEAQSWWLLQRESKEPRPAHLAVDKGVTTPDGGANDTLAALAALGDALAVFHIASGRLSAVSDAWRALCPQLPLGATATELDTHLPGCAAALQLPSDASPRDVRVGSTRQWNLRIAKVGGAQLVLRLTDRHEQGRALQRQLDDREQLLFTSRVLSVGEMAATLAHELNQPIGATANLLRGLRARLGRRRSTLVAEEAAALDQAIEQVMFAARVITRIREFTHSHQPRRTMVDVAALLRASASLLDWDLQRSHAQLVLDLPEHAANVYGDAVMLQQVVVNLMRNALDALRTDPPPEPKLSLSLTPRDRELEVRVRDNGCGLSNAAAEKLFVPFASTKPNGTGIGLLICRSFIEQHQGRLWFSRNPDRGATFHVTLPCAAPVPALSTLSTLPTLPTPAKGMP